jgi:hypothetical protein
MTFTSKHQAFFKGKCQHCRFNHLWNCANILRIISLLCVNDVILKCSVPNSVFPNNPCGFYCIILTNICAMLQQNWLYFLHSFSQKLLTGTDPQLVNQ